jgi:hypothetical protein
LTDFAKADKDPQVIQYFIDKGLISVALQNDLVAAGKAIAKVRSRLNLTWHHHEDLETLELVPSVLNNELIPHLGGTAIQRAIDNGKILLSEYKQWLAGTN